MTGDRERLSSHDSFTSTRGGGHRSQCREQKNLVAVPARIEALRRFLKRRFPGRDFLCRIERWSDSCAHFAPLTRTRGTRS